MPIPSPNTPGAIAARNEVINVLKDDHERVLRAFRDFDQIESLQACQKVVQRTCADLKVHGALEDELFYPAVRAAGIDPDLIDDFEVAHRNLEALVARMELLAPHDEKYRATFRVMGGCVRQHVQEEERKLFPLLARARIPWETLCDRLYDRLAELCDDLGVVPAAPPDEPRLPPLRRKATEIRVRAHRPVPAGVGR